MFIFIFLIYHFRDHIRYSEIEFTKILFLNKLIMQMKIVSQSLIFSLTLGSTILTPEAKVTSIEDEVRKTLDAFPLLNFMQSPVLILPTRNQFLCFRKNGYSPFRDNASKGAFRCFFIVDFLLFLAPTRESNPAGQSPNLT